VEELIIRREEFSEKLNQLSGLDDDLVKLRKELKHSEDLLKEQARELSKGRKNAAPRIEEQVNALLKETGMPDAHFQLELDQLPEGSLRPAGTDHARFLFSANKGHAL